MIKKDKKLFVDNSRRKFIKNTVAGVAAASAYSLLSACSTFDDYLFEDRNEFSDEVIIVGGGIAGIYLAQKLRSNKTEFRLFEASDAFGGRIKSVNGIDYGASLLSKHDKLAAELVESLGLTKKYIDSEFYYVQEGMQSVTDKMVERIIGLIPYRSFRLRWKLVEINKRSSGYELTFENPSGQKQFTCKRVALAIPPSQWEGIRGLTDLPEMKWSKKWLETLRVENTLKLVLPLNAASGIPSYQNRQYNDLFVRHLVKKGLTTPAIEIDVKYLLTSGLSIDDIYGVLKQKSPFNANYYKLSTDQVLDWQQIKYIGGSSFTNFLQTPSFLNSNFQLVGDYVGSGSLYSVEGALLSALQVSEAFL